MASRIPIESTADVSLRRSAADLLAGWAALETAVPRGRRLMPSEAAQRLGVTELELLSAAAGDAGASASAHDLSLWVSKLEPGWPQLLADLADLGTVKTVTRNAHAVIEVNGPWKGLSLAPGAPHGLVIGGTIDLRLFPGRWRFALAVEREVRGRASRSVQFFGADGVALHKLFLLPESDADAFRRLVSRHRAADQQPVTSVEPSPALPMPNPAPDAAAFEAGWRAMQDPHEFFGLLGRHRVTRRQALDLVPRDLARPVGRGALDRTLLAARELDCPLMIFVGNPGCIQIHSGPAKRIVRHDGWLNVLDPGFDLHVREDAIDECFVVRKPAEAGRSVGSLEAYTAEGELLLSIFGLRKPGQDELPEWREWLRALPRTEVAA